MAMIKLGSIVIAVSSHFSTLLITMDEALVILSNMFSMYLL